MATICGAVAVPPPSNAIDSLSQMPLLSNPNAGPATRTEMVYHGTGGLALRSGDWVYLPMQGSMGYTAPPIYGYGTPYAMLGFTNSDLDKDGNPRADAPPAQLYDIRRDPRQSTNLCNQEFEAMQRLAERLRELTGQGKSD
jgi:hypothetical protein